MPEYTIETTPSFDKALAKLDPFSARVILKWLMIHIEHSENPGQYGEALKGNYKGQWRYPIGDYRVICNIDDKKVVVLALSVGHRKGVYR